MAAESGTFAITGIPPPADAKVLTKTIPYAPKMPLRYEISKYVSSDSLTSDPIMQKQWTLFVLALEKFKNMKVDEKLSFFQVAGIHGYPETAWDGVDAPKQDPTDPPPGGQPFGGYCHHNTISFPAWHRPYMLLYEQCIWLNMKKIIVDWKKEAEKDHKSFEWTQEWLHAADTWRLPYWDWARKQDYNKDFALPFVLTIEQVPIWPPVQIKSLHKIHENPLWGFDNPEKGADKKPLAMGSMPKGKEQWNIKDDESSPPTMPWSQCSGVSRYGIFANADNKTYTGLEGINAFDRANVAMANFSKAWYNPTKDPTWQSPGTLADAVNRMFSPQYNSTWGTFASTKWLREKEASISTGYLSLEYIHNNVHNISGGVTFKDGIGHMSDVPVAAFDPMFWLHHCNIDRYLAIWQALNWKLWWDEQEPINPDSPNVPDPGPTDPLTPFHTKTNGNPNGDFWTPNMARDWTKLHYQYDDLVPQSDAVNADGSLNEAKYIEDLQVYVHKTYPSTSKLIHKVFADDTVPNEGFLGANDGSWNDYIINVVYDRYALNGKSYTIQFYLGGDANNPASTFTFPENYVGQVYSFGGMSGSTTEGGCANCGTQATAKVLSKAQVPLTIPLVHQALSSDYSFIHNILQDAVNDYLDKHLHWRFMQIGGEEKPASYFPDTKISVWSGTGKPRRINPEQNDGGVPVPPRYVGYKPLYKSTERKTCGLRSNDRVLGQTVLG